MSNDEAQSANATKAVVDDAMRIDILGPNVCKVLKEHNPTTRQIKAILVEAITSDTKVQDALVKLAEDQALTRKGKGLTNIQAIALTALVTLVVTLGGTTLYQHFVK